MRSRRPPDSDDLATKATSTVDPSPARNTDFLSGLLGAIRHDLLVAYKHIVRDHVPYRDLGPDLQRKRYSFEHRARRLQRQREALGYDVTLERTERTEQAA